MALEADLPHRRADELFRIRRSVRLMAGRAFADLFSTMREDERSALLGMTRHAGRFAGARRAQMAEERQRERALRAPAVRIVAGRAGHPAAIEPVRVRLVAERCRLRVARAAQRELRLRDEMRGPWIGFVDRVAGQAIHLVRVRMHAARGLFVAEQAGFIGAGASPWNADLRLVAAGLDVLRAVAVARGADVVGDDAVRHTAARVGIGEKCFRLIVAIRAGGNGGGRFLRGWCLRRGRFLRATADSEREQEQEGVPLHRQAILSERR